MKAALAPRIAEALASSFLAKGAWTRHALDARGAVTIGDQPNWMGALVESVLARFRYRSRSPRSVAV